MKSKTPKPKKTAILKINAKDSTVVFDLGVAKHGLEPILGAAYLLTDRAFVLLEGDRAKTLKVGLSPKSAALELSVLADAFIAELRSQEVRWAIAKNNQPIREYITEQAVLLANGKLPPAPSAPAQEAPADQLTDEQRSEIEKLIAEVESEIKTMNEKKAAPADPKGITASWEEKQEARLKEGKA